MSDYGLIFQAWGIQAMLDSRKTQTRRTKGLAEINQDPDRWHMWWVDDVLGMVTFSDFPKQGEKGNLVRVKFPCGKPGDRIYVKETWSSSLHLDGFDPDGGERVHDCPAYRATNTYRCGNPLPDTKRLWKSAMFMPKNMARIWLTVQQVRVERVQQISIPDSISEGMPAGLVMFPIDWYHQEWDKINTKNGLAWDKNPYVFAYSFAITSSKESELCQPTQKTPTSQ